MSLSNVLDNRDDSVGREDLLGSLELLSGDLTSLNLLGVSGEEDLLRLEFLELADVNLESLNGLVLSAGSTAMPRPRAER